MNARDVFKGLGTNFMTPVVLDYRWATVNGKRWAVELSEGTGFTHQPIWGVTFRDPDNPDEPDVELSGMFRDYDEAWAWFGQND